MAALLEVREVTLTHAGAPGALLSDVSFEISAAEIVGLVGDSGSGKSSLGRTLVGLNPTALRASGSIGFDGQELLPAQERRWRRLRGSGIGWMPQDPAIALNPVQRVGEQLRETLRTHTPSARFRTLREASIQWLEQVGLSEVPQILRRLPHELSGGQRQRLLLALSLAPRPRLLIVDEPTSALDPIARAELLFLLEQVRRETHAALILISHDRGAIAAVCDRALVIHKGSLRATGFENETS